MPYTKGVYFPPIIRNPVRQPRIEPLLEDVLKDPGSWLSILSLSFTLVVTGRLLCLWVGRGGKSKGQRDFVFSPGMGTLPTSYWLELD